MSSRFICVHGHFYQPPRENPWLEAIEPQHSAAPFHDWNERILAECYAPNTASRILDDEDRIVAIVNNYARISFDFGPTLLSWLEHAAPACYEAIREADRESGVRFSGHGSAMAQIYNHLIMPLASDRDQELQVVWGLKDFEHRFGRTAEGMWLSETAVDTSTLEALARHGVRFTVLSPYQARSVRPAGAREWQDVSGGRVDTTQAYVKHLPSGRSIALFFYDGDASKAIAFEGLLHRGESFASRLLSAHRERPAPGATLTHVATDGESYGHHHPHGDMALAYALDVISKNPEVELTNYGEFLERFPPRHEVEIVERSSWSCAHGVERWRSDCGCHTGGPAGFNQAWRAPLREALDWFRDTVREPTARALGELVDQPERAVLDYIDVILDRSRTNVDAFLESRGVGDTTAQVRVLKLLELERQLQLMYTSCGWFFNDLAGIETVQVLRYLGRAVQLAEDVLGQTVESSVLDRLALARSNRPQAGTGRDLYRTQVLPSKITWEMLGAHYGINSLFKTSNARIYCYDVVPEALEAREASRSRLLLGRVRLSSFITRSSERLGFAVYHRDDHDVTAGVERLEDDTLATELVEPFLDGDGGTLLRRLDARYGRSTFDLHSLFGDEQRRILDVLLHATLEEAEAAHRHIYEHHWGVVRLLAELEVPLPDVLSVAAEVVLNARLRRALAETPGDPTAIGDLVREAVTEAVKLDEASLAFTASESLETMSESYFAEPGDETKLRALSAQVHLVRSLPFEVDLWKIQNAYFQHAKRAGSAVPEGFAALGEALTIRLLP